MQGFLIFRLKGLQQAHTTYMQVTQYMQILTVMVLWSLNTTVTVTMLSGGSGGGLIEVDAT